MLLCVKVRSHESIKRLSTCKCKCLFYKLNVAAGFWWFASVQCQDTTTSSMVTIANPNPNCFLDPTKQWDTSASNYADCTTEQAKAQGVTSCCKSGGKMCVILVFTPFSGPLTCNFNVHNNILKNN